MRLEAQNISKKFSTEWIFKNISLNACVNDFYAITGSNGSGKSTLLQILSGYMLPNTGYVKLFQNQTEIPSDDYFRYQSLASPFLELIEQFTLAEQINFYFRFKQIKNCLSADELLKLSNLKLHSNKLLCNFSSGMKQRVKLLLAFAADTPILFLDEPCTNLDSKGIEWYKQMFTDFSASRIVIVSSNNQSEELFKCNKFISIDDFKKPE